MLVFVGEDAHASTYSQSTKRWNTEHSLLIILGMYIYILHLHTHTHMHTHTHTLCYLEYYMLVLLSAYLARLEIDYDHL